MKKYLPSKNDELNRPVLEPFSNIDDIDSKPLVGLQYDDVNDHEEEKNNNNHYRPDALFRNEDQMSHTDKDKKFMRMIFEMITQDGVLNLQAKNIQQGDPYDSSIIHLNRIFCSKATNNRFDSIVRLNLSSNKIQMIDGDFCKNLPNVQQLDLRANQIEEVSHHIKAMASLRVLKVDKNNLVRLPDELYDIIILQELTFQQNKINYLSPKIGQLIELQKLNIASNMISKIPEEISRCEELQTLCIQNNRFASFPCSFLRLTNLKELSLEWFIYAKPPKPQYISRKTREGTQILESLMVLCNLLQKYKMSECALITFLENYSDDNFDKNQRDNRQRTPLHKAAVMGDTGVIEGLLMDKANTNLLDKDNCTPLCLAIRQENYEAAQCLIDGEANVNLGGGIFGSPVHLAVVRLKISIIQSLIDKNADLNKQDSDGNTPLHLVMNIFSKNPERCSHILELLVLNGANVNQKNFDHWAPLHTAVRKGQEKGVNAIIRLNKKLKDKGQEQFDLNISGGIQHWSSLHLAAHASQLQIILDLVAAGADIFQRNQINQLPRHCAKGNYIMTKNIKLVEQECLSKQFQTFKLNNLCFITLYTTSDIVKTSKMTPIEPDCDSLSSYLSQHNYHNSCYHLLKQQQVSDPNPFKLACNDSPRDIDADIADTLKERVSRSFDEEYDVVDEEGDVMSNPVNQVMDKRNEIIAGRNRPQKKEGEGNEFREKVEEMKSEMNGVNMFKLKDLLIREQEEEAQMQTQVLQEKFEALSKMKKFANQVGFLQAMRSLFIAKDFFLIKEQIIQLELLAIISSSNHFQMIESLQQFLSQNQPEDEDLEEAIQDAISELKIAKKANERNPLKRNKFQLRPYAARTSFNGVRPPNQSQLIEQIIINQSNRMKSSRDPYQKEGGNQQRPTPSRQFIPPRDPRELLHSNPRDDRIPSSPQSINVFENKVARRIEEQIRNNQQNPISPQSRMRSLDPMKKLKKSSGVQQKSNSMSSFRSLKSANNSQVSVNKSGVQVQKMKSPRANGVLPLAKRKSDVVNKYKKQ